MAQNEQRDAKKSKKQHFPSGVDDLFCTESILVCGEHSAVLHGCGRILFYGRERICFSMRNRSVSVFGEGLCCTVFSPTGVTVEGKIRGVCYCREGCQGRCDWTVGKEAEI